MSDTQVTHFADDDTLAYINRLERELAEAKSELKMWKQVESLQGIADVQLYSELSRDTARLDWLADVDNHVGNVILPRSIVEQNLDSMRHAIDVAMGAGE